jgi:hypothetical protein
MLIYSLGFNDAAPHFPDQWVEQVGQQQHGLLLPLI